MCALYFNHLTACCNVDFSLNPADTERDRHIAYLSNGELDVANCLGGETGGFSFQHVRPWWKGQKDIETILVRLCCASSASALVGGGYRGSGNRGTVLISDLSSKL